MAMLRDTIARLTAERDAAQEACANYAQALVDESDRLAKLEWLAEAAQRYVTARNENRVELFMLFGSMQQALAALSAKETT